MTARNFSPVSKCKIDPVRIQPSARTDRSSILALDVVVLARDEAAILEPTLREIGAQLGIKDRLHVVADHCHDHTDSVAASAGAITHVRWNGRPGKGPALHWWLLRSSASGGAGVVVFDADSLPGPDLIEKIRSRLQTGSQAVQAIIRPLVLEPHPISSLSAFSEMKEQAVWDRAWAACGLSVRLRGTGMAFDRATLTQVSHRLSSNVEDAELSLLLVEQGFHIDRLASSYVLDPKPTDALGAARQRARWLTGQLSLLRVHRHAILQLATETPANWPLLATLLLKPKSLLTPLLALAALIGAAGWLTGWLPPFLALLPLLPLAVELTSVAIGLVLTPNPGTSARLLPRWPAYLKMWLDGVRLALAHDGGWLRARSEISDPSVREPRAAES